eukprot:scaffold26345_cov70-Phaeocystis_antarctica.AAC.2
MSTCAFAPHAYSIPPRQSGAARPGRIIIAPPAFVSGREGPSIAVFADKTQYPSTRYLLTYLHAEHYSTTLAYAKGNAGHYAKRGFKPGRTQKQSPKTPRVDKVCVLKVQTEQGVGCRNGV